jgi:hypothetical protein
MRTIQVNFSPAHSTPNSPLDIPGVVRASNLQHPAVPVVSSGLTAIDALTGGLPRGGLTEICGAASSGRTSAMLSIMAEATARGELCALVDASDAFDPHAAAAAGVDLDRVLWIRCTGPLMSAQRSSATETASETQVASRALRAKQHTGSIMPAAKIWYGRPPARSERNAAATETEAPIASKFKRQNSKLPGDHRESPAKGIPGSHSDNKRRWASRIDQALKAADLVLQGGGFGLVIIDFADVPFDIARRIPLTSWFRFRRAVENTPAVLLAVARESCAKTCASLVVQMAATTSPSTATPAASSADTPSHARIFIGLEVKVEALRSRNETGLGQKKPPRPDHATFQSRTQWAG